MYVVSVINYKGGVGKTTVTANLGAELANRGMKVLLIDLDPQTSLTFSFYDPDDWRERLRDGRTVKRWYDGLRGDTPAVTLGELVVSPGPANAHLTGAGRLDLIASHLGLADIDLALARGVADGEDYDRELFRVRGALAEGLHDAALDGYDLVLIDCPPNFNVVTQSAVIASDHLLIPARADYLSTLGIDHLCGSVRELVDRYNADARRFATSRRHHKVAPDVAGVVFTMIQLTAQRPIAAHQGYLDQVRALGLPVFPTALRENVTLFAGNTPRGVPVVLRHRVTAPVVQEELRQITTEFIAHLQPREVTV
ncbi:ParA family protein [Micromonospora sp. HM134]|uniref:ParA family protein n=1 Tax=Micromonospora sp. HM134 TaxID=2583243 RepID=UPI001198A03F|nr:AAA family ATPase [Micromonospora sp. HM134]QDY06728.1 ParA family protein [Micromonospora sp. HM134]